jgi:hypothetical protein
VSAACRIWGVCEWRDGKDVGGICRALLEVILSVFVSTLFLASAQNVENRPLVSRFSVHLSFRPHGISWLPLDGFP